jgi:CHAD domain-containing protein
VTVSSTTPRTTIPDPAVQIRDDAIREDEPLGEAIRRLCVSCVGRAIDGLTDADAPDAGVHSARKAMKRVRAGIRLVRDEVGHWRYRQENVVLRDTARAVAPVRDSAVLVQTLDRLADEYGASLTPGAWDGLRQLLVDRHTWASHRVLRDSEALVRLLTTLRTARRRYAAWPVVPADGRPGEIADSFEVIAPGIRRVYRRGRRAMAIAEARGTEEGFHQWRKRVKYLRHQVEFLETLWPELLRATSTELDRLGETLGFEHDLFVLESVAGDEPGAVLDRSARRLLLAVIHHERHALQRDALTIGTRLYAEQPDAFVGRVGSYWAAWRPGA